MRDVVNGQYVNKVDIDIYNIINERYKGYEYIGGYTGIDGYMMLRCRTCGNVMRKSSQMLKPSRNKVVMCSVCVGKAKAERVCCNEIDKVRRKAEIEEIKELKELSRKELIISRVKTKECNQCGAQYKTNLTRSKFCCKRCAGRYHDKVKEIRKRILLKSNGEVDNSVTLDKLIKRDKSMCMICGKKIDIDDYTHDDKGSFIALSNYPSIDHIKPVSLGGTHTWDNVQLSHMQCNTVKSNKTVYMGVYGQMAFSV